MASQQQDEERTSPAAIGDTESDPRMFNSLRTKEQMHLTEDYISQKTPVDGRPPGTQLSNSSRVRLLSLDEEEPLATVKRLKLNTSSDHQQSEPDPVSIQDEIHKHALPFQFGPYKRKNQKALKKKPLSSSRVQKSKNKIMQSKQGVSFQQDVVNQLDRKLVSATYSPFCIHEIYDKDISPQSRIGKCNCSLEEKRVIYHLKTKGVPVLTRGYMKYVNSAAGKNIGAGSYGRCSLAHDPETRQELVIKTFIDNDLNWLVIEAVNMQLMRKVPGVQRLVGVCVKSRQMVSYFAGETAKSYFQKNTSLIDAGLVFLQVARTLQGMINTGLCHNDIKQDNVCISVQGVAPVAAVIDLGLAREVDSWEIFEPENPESLPWVAPELLLKTGSCGEPSDVYGMGYFMNQVISCGKLLTGQKFTSTLNDMMTWIKAAESFEPRHRPRLSTLIEILEVLLKETPALHPHQEYFPMKSADVEQKKYVAGPTHDGGSNPVTSHCLSWRQSSTECSSSEGLQGEQ